MPITCYCKLVVFISHIRIFLFRNSVFTDSISRSSAATATSAVVTTTRATPAAATSATTINNTYIRWSGNKVFVITIGDILSKCSQPYLDVEHYSITHCGHCSKRQHLFLYTLPLVTRHPETSNPVDCRTFIWAPHVVGYSDYRTRLKHGQIIVE